MFFCLIILIPIIIILIYLIILVISNKNNLEGTLDIEGGSKFVISVLSYNICRGAMRGEAQSLDAQKLNCIQDPPHTQKSVQFSDCFIRCLKFLNKVNVQKNDIINLQEAAGIATILFNNTNTHLTFNKLKYKYGLINSRFKYSAPNVKAEKSDIKGNNVSIRIGINKSIFIKKELHWVKPDREIRLTSLDMTYRLPLEKWMQLLKDLGLEREITRKVEAVT